MFVSFDDSSFLYSRPEGLVPSLLQLPCNSLSLPRWRFDKCTVGLDRPVEVVFGNVPTVLVVVLYELNQLPESRVGILDGLSEVRSVVVERLVCISFNNHRLDSGVLYI